MNAARNFILYSLETGAIKSFGRSCSPDRLVPQGDGIILDNPHDPDRDADCVDLATGQVVHVPDRPSDAYVLDPRQQIWVFDQVTQEFKLRRERDARLAACDYTQLPDVPMETKAAWAEYRQALREVPQQATFPYSVAWPTAPT